LGLPRVFRLPRLSTLTSTFLSSLSSGVTAAGPQDYVSTSIDYQQRFSIGAQLDAFVDNAAQVLYAGTSQYDPFHAPSTSFTLTQPLLRGPGREVNLRFLRVAQLDQHASRLLFEQQVLETVYGVSRLYYDLVSLGENVGVQEESLTAAQRLYDDDKNQVDQGTLAPIELTRAQALLSSSRLNLIQAQGEYRQQEAILRQQLLRRLGDPSANFASIVPQDRIVVPDDPPALDVPALVDDAIANRPDLAQAGLQVKADEISVRASRNYVKPGLNAFANVQTRGSAIAPFTELGSGGTGLVTVPADITQG
jgi:outer membrane protein